MSLKRFQGFVFQPCFCSPPRSGTCPIKLVPLGSFGYSAPRWVSLASSTEVHYCTLDMSFQFFLFHHASEDQIGVGKWLAARLGATRTRRDS
jgi:hypothetical protein